LIFTFQDIKHSYEDRSLFNGVGYSLKEGGLLVVKGANGSGKTTLLKILAGLVTPDDGYIFYNDNEISEDYSFYHKNINYLGHKNSLEEEFTVKENLEFFAKLSDSKETLAAITHYFNLESRLDFKCKNLSAGWKRRVALSKLMMIKRNIWIIDEPFANLDDEVIDITLKLIASFCDQGGICIISCHQEVKLPFGAHIFLEDWK
jgi:heme exporter protein A